MADANSKIDEYVRKQRHKKFRVYSVLFSLLVLLIMALVAYSTGTTTEVAGNTPFTFVSAYSLPVYASQ